MFFIQRRADSPIERLFLAHISAGFRVPVITVPGEVIDFRIGVGPDYDIPVTM